MCQLYSLWEGNWRPSLLYILFFLHLYSHLTPRIPTHSTELVPSLVWVLVGCVWRSIRLVSYPAAHSLSRTDEAGKSQAMEGLMGLDIWKELWPLLRTQWFCNSLNPHDNPIQLVALFPYYIWGTSLFSFGYLHLTTESHFSSLFPPTPHPQATPHYFMFPFSHTSLFFAPVVLITWSAFPLIHCLKKLYSFFKTPLQSPSYVKSPWKPGVQSQSLLLCGKMLSLLQSLWQVIFPRASQEQNHIGKE